MWVQRDSDLTTGPVWVGQHQAWSYDVEGGVDVHGVGVFEGDDVDIVLWSEVAAHPFNPHVVCYLDRNGGHVSSMLAPPTACLGC